MPHPDIDRPPGGVFHDEGCRAAASGQV